MTLRPGVDTPVPRAVLIRSAAAALTAGGASPPASLGLILSDDAELSALNAEHMGHAGPTDVLSFPLWASSEEVAFALPPGRRRHVGDVIVSVERAAEQAAQGSGGQTGDVRWSTAEELRLLVVHGALHVCGWDHAQPEEEEAMRSLERRILEETR